MRRHLLVLASSTLFLTVSYAQTSRIHAVPDDSETVKLVGNHHPSARAEYEVGRVAPEYRMEKMILALNPSEEQTQGLDALIAAQQDPSSNSYQKWLTPEQVAEQFGVSQNDVDQVTAWLGSHGFTIDEVPAGRRTIVFSGTAGMVEGAFHTEMRQYRVNGALHYANATDPSIPQALAEVVRGTVTLHNFGRSSMRTVKQTVAEFTSGGSYYLAPADYWTIYNLNPLFTAGIDGTGASIAIVGRTNINVSDVTQFRSYFGLPVNNPQVIVNGTNPGITSDIDEAILDVEWSGAVGRGATVKLVVSASTNSTDGVDLSAQYIVTNKVAPVMSTSYGSCEAQMGTAEMSFYKNLWQQAAAEGISTMISAGDSGAAGCDSPSESTATYGKAINGLCSSVYSVCVGGTQFSDTSNYSAYWATTNNATTKASAISYIPEAAWNQGGSVSGGSGLWATGGGASIVYAKPSWQVGPGVPADGVRDVPDVSLAASTHDGFLVVEGGSMYVIGGTSAASPSFAGIMAVVNQKYGAQGNPNPTLYGLAALETNHATAHSYFHDITSGSNTVPGVTGYTAAAGYDLATGLGSVNASDLVNFWKDATVTVAPTMSAAMSAGTLSIRQGASGTSTATITVAGGFSSAVALAVSGAPAGVTATLASKSLAAPGSGSSVLTIAVAATAAVGTSTITVTATGGGLTSSVNLILTVAAPFTVTTNLSAVTVAPGASTPVTLSSAVSSGFSGAVVLTAVGTLPAGLTVGFTPSTIAAPGSGTSTVAIGATSATVPGVYSITLKGTSGSTSSSTTVSVTVAAPATFTLSASPSTITAAPGGSATSTITLTPLNGFNSSVNVAITGTPAGVTLTFVPNRATLAMTAVVANTAAAGTYPITLTGTGGGVTPLPTTVVTLVVSGFKVTAAATAALTHGSTVTIPVTTSVTGGFSGALALTATGLPTGVTAAFTPASITSPAAGSSSLKLTGATTATLGTKSITIVATSATGAVESVVVSLTVK